MNKSGISRTVIPVAGVEPIMRAPDGPGPLDGAARPDLFGDLVDSGHAGSAAGHAPTTGMLRPTWTAGA